jgi:hypothetical protein
MTPRSLDPDGIAQKLTAMEAFLGDLADLADGQPPVTASRAAVISRGR